MTPRAKPTPADWGGTIQKFATAVLAVSALVGGLIMAVVGPRLAKLESDMRAELEQARVSRAKIEARMRQHFLLGIRDNLDLADAIGTAPGPDRDRRLQVFRQKLDQEARLLEAKEE